MGGENDIWKITELRKEIETERKRIVEIEARVMDHPNAWTAINDLHGRTEDLKRDTDKLRKNLDGHAHQTHHLVNERISVLEGQVAGILEGQASERMFKERTTGRITPLAPEEGIEAPPPRNRHEEELDDTTAAIEKVREGLAESAKSTMQVANKVILPD